MHQQGLEETFSFILRMNSKAFLHTVFPQKVVLSLWRLKTGHLFYKCTWGLPPTPGCTIPRFLADLNLESLSHFVPECLKTVWWDGSWAVALGMKRKAIHTASFEQSSTKGNSCGEKLLSGNPAGLACHSICNPLQFPLPCSAVERKVVFV